jgi:hypothetical protein
MRLSAAANASSRRFRLAIFRCVRQVEWIEEEAVGPGEWKATGTLVDLLVGGPYPSLSPPDVPPLDVLNELLVGPGGGGMNGGRRWRPFVIDDAEYREVVVELVRSRGFERNEVPGWVLDKRTWHIWLMERRWGVPSGPHRALNAKADALEKSLEDAKSHASMSPRELAVLSLECQRARDQAAHFIDAWTMTPQHTKYRRTRRWLDDLRFQRKAAEMAGDIGWADSAAAQAERLRDRCSRHCDDDKWPAQWEDWPDFPPLESRNF